MHHSEHSAEGPTDEGPARLGELRLPGRRQFLRDSGLGFGALALAQLLGSSSTARTSAAPATTVGRTVECGDIATTQRQRLLGSGGAPSLEGRTVGTPHSSCR